MMAEEDDDGSIETCNITYEPLTKSHIRLNCGHAFNYRPLYIDVFGQRFGDPYDPFVVLRNAEEYKIFCPYCRVLHNKPVLPFVVEPGTALTYSVNTLDLAVYKHFISCHPMQGVEHHSVWFVRGLGCQDCLAVYGAFLPDSLAHYCGHHYFRRRTEARRRAAALEKAVKRATMNQRAVLRTATAVDRAIRAVERATRAMERDAKAAERVAKRVAKDASISPKTMETRPSNTNHTNGPSSKLSIAEEKRDAAVRAYELAQQKAALSERAVQDMTPSL
jgi:hypothetical protein